MTEAEGMRGTPAALARLRVLDLSRILAGPWAGQILGDLGAEIIIAETGAEGFAIADKLVLEQGLTFIHPFDDPLVIAGQGTIGAEILQHTRQPGAVFVPVGGGGLIAGIAGYIVKPLEFSKFVEAVQTLGYYWSMCSRPQRGFAAPPA